MFGALMMLMIFKGIFASLAGPVPSYDMQRILSTRKPSEAAKMSAMTMVALSPRYFMVTGLAVLSIVYLSPELSSMGKAMDFETILPVAITRFVPVGLKGLLLVGLFVAFMGTLAAFVNSASASLFNDLYKRYINPHAEAKTYVRFSYVASIILVIVGVIFGFYAKSLNSLTLWITSSLYGGYAAANVLKWIWWRLNGYGYFWGMLAGLIASTLKLIFLPDVTDIYLFPAILCISFVGCFLRTLLTPPDDEKTVMSFYRNVRPWGFWKPIRDKVMAEDPTFEENKDFGRDCVNVLVGIVWQMCLVTLPIFIVIHKFDAVMIVAALLVATSLVLKFNWYDKLGKADRGYEQID